MRKKSSPVAISLPEIPGKEIYLSLKEKGILVRHFDDAKLTDYNRITIGSKEEMQALIHALEEIVCAK